MPEDTPPEASTSDTQPTVPLPQEGAAAPAAAPAATPAAAVPAAAVPAAAPVATASSSPWRVLLPVLVGIGALLIGLAIGGGIGFRFGTHFDRGPIFEHRMPFDLGNQGGPFDSRDRDRDGKFGLPGMPGMRGGDQAPTPVEPSPSPTPEG